MSKPSEQKKESNSQVVKVFIRDMAEKIASGKVSGECNLSYKEINNFTEVEVIKDLGLALVNNKSVTKLNLENSISYAPVLKFLLPKENQSISSLNLKGNLLYGVGEGIVAALLEEHKNINSLDISNTGFSFEDLKKILEHNYSLTHLNFTTIKEGFDLSQTLDSGLGNINKERESEINKYIERNCFLELAKLFHVSEKLTTTAPHISSGAQEFLSAKGEQYVKDKIKSEEFSKIIQEFRKSPNSAIASATAGKVDAKSKEKEECLVG